MTKENPVVLIYKRTHTGDPDERGIFGINTCMKQDRRWKFDAVIGIGGKKPDSGDEKIAYKINYVGLGAKEHSINPEDGHPYIIFKHFRLFDEKGQLVKDVAPKLYKYMYVDANVRSVKSNSLSEDIQLEIREILKLAENAPPSSGYENLDGIERSSRTPSTLTPTKENDSTNNEAKGGCK